MRQAPRRCIEGSTLHEKQFCFSHDDHSTALSTEDGKPPFGRNAKQQNRTGRATA
jgi:hypothetical protein